jgi:hypothetical protein
MAYKECSNCQSANGVRTIYCKSCGNKFESADTSAKPPKEKKPKKEKVVKPKKQKVIKQKTHLERQAKIENVWLDDWLSLQPGDMIVVRGGPYHLSKDGDGNLVKNDMNEKGLFKVIRLEKDGILAFPKGKKHECHGTHFIYMGHKHRSVTGVYLKPHRIKRAVLRSKGYE